jgi:chromosome segregation ATPase
MQAQEHNAALRREADSAENRGAEARIRVQALEQELAAVKAEGEDLRKDLSKLQETDTALEAQHVRNQALETRCAMLQNELDARQNRLEELQDALAFQQAENGRLQESYAALLQKQAERPVMAAQQSCAAQPTQEDLLYLRREMQRMRDSYDALVLSVLGNGRHPEGDAQCRQDLLVTINHQMDQALDYLEKLVNLREEASVQPAKVQPVRKETEKKSATLEEILRMVRGNR